MLYDALPVMCETISENVLKHFLKRCFSFGWQLYEAGELTDNLFENTLRVVKFVLQGGIKNEINRNVIFEILASYFDVIHLESEVSTK